MKVIDKKTGVDVTSLFREDLERVINGAKPIHFSKEEKNNDDDY